MIRFIRNAGISTGAALIILGLGVALAFVAVNTVQDYGSFGVGMVGVFGLLIMLAAFYWASHPATRQWPGTFIGFGTAIGMVILTILAVAMKALEHFSWYDFGWGLLSLIILAASAGVVYGTRLILN